MIELGGFVRLPPYDLPWNYSWGAIAFETQNRLNATTGMVGVSMGTSGAGHLYRITSVMFNHVPNFTGQARITVNSRVWFRGNVFAFFNGYVVSHAALGVFVNHAGRRSENTTEIFHSEGFLALNWGASDFVPRTVSVTVPVQQGSNMQIFVDAIQWVSAWGGATGALSNLSMRINSVTMSPLST